MQVQYVVWDTNFVKVAGAFFNMPAHSSQPLILDPYLESHYEPVKDVSGIRIMKCKPVLLRRISTGYLHESIEMNQSVPYSKSMVALRVSA